jgi:hypothetical protein
MLNALWKCSSQGSAGAVVTPCGPDDWRIPGQGQRNQPPIMETEGPETLGFPTHDCREDFTACGS